ncbi:MAG: hypothetical protein ACTHQQ_17025, partial [Solirubrobacteraceae bacterium]
MHAAIKQLFVRNGLARTAVHAMIRNTGLRDALVLSPATEHRVSGDRRTRRLRAQVLFHEPITCLVVFAEWFATDGKAPLNDRLVPNSRSHRAGGTVEVLGDCASQTAKRAKRARRSRWTVAEEAGTVSNRLGAQLALIAGPTGGTVIVIACIGAEHG